MSSSGGRGQDPAAGAVLTRAGLLRRCPPRDLWAMAAALAGPLTAAAVLLPFRASWSNTNAALLLVVVVVAVAAAGNRLAGAVAAVGAAVWFDFFFTLPYYRLTIRGSDDVTTAVLLLVTGLAVSRLAAWARKLKVTAVGLLAGLLDLQERRFEYGSLCSHPPRLDSDGSIADGHSALDVEPAGLPAELELRVVGNGHYYGRFLMRRRPGARPTLQARLVAVALAEQVGHAYSAARASWSARRQSGLASQ